MQKDIFDLLKIVNFITNYNRIKYYNFEYEGKSLYDDLAKQLNEDKHIFPNRIWTAHSLECFFSRIRNKYKSDELKSYFDIEETIKEISSNFQYDQDYVYLSDCSAESNRCRIAELQLKEDNKAIEKWKKTEINEITLEQKIIFKRQYNKIEEAQIPKKLTSKYISQFDLKKYGLNK